MTAYNVSKKFKHSGRLSQKAIDVMRMFGVTKDRLDKIDFSCQCDIEINAGDVIYITGPSGSGKTVLLNLLRDKVPESKRFDFDQVEFDEGKRVIDCISGDIISSLKCLSKAGLGDLPAMVNTPANLSVGQFWRFRLAVALASGKEFIFADEFCSNLDRVTAATIAYNIRKFADRYKTTFIIASSHQDILRDLSPDAVITRDLSGNTEVTYKYTRHGEREKSSFV
jgi:ABC-type ATPase with predicted acetyltransferase domain